MLFGWSRSLLQDDLTNPFTYFLAASLDYVPQQISKEEFQKKKARSSPGGESGSGSKTDNNKKNQQ